MLNTGQRQHLLGVSGTYCLSSDIVRHIERNLMKVLQKSALSQSRKNSLRRWRKLLQSSFFKAQSLATQQAVVRVMQGKARTLKLGRMAKTLLRAASGLTRLESMKYPFLCWNEVAFIE